jgi:predicted nucleic acid-binding protein
MRFVDTNVLLYAMSKAPEEQGKARIALEVLEDRDLVLSVQVLQEFYVQATRPNKRDRITHAQAAALIEAYLRFQVVENTVALFHAALGAKERFGVSLWDAAIIEAARSASCSTVLSEDLNDGQDHHGVIVTNPFGVPR